MSFKSRSSARVNVTRGHFAESVHKVDIVVADSEGALVEVWGEQDREIFPRSAIKALQAIPLVESGAADQFGFTQKHLALACSSHNGQPMHVSCADEMLQAAGLSEICLECGARAPELSEDKAELFRQNKKPQPIHNACSGKHAGFLALATHAGFETAGYINIEHPVQKEIAGILETVVGTPHRPENYGIDGCSIPTYPVPLSKLAAAFARFGVGEDRGKKRESAMLELRDACFVHPEMVAGDHRVCTGIMRILPHRAFVKFGAEGVFTAALPELGYGIAMKARDGSRRAVEVAISAVIARYLPLDDAELASMQPLINPVLKNFKGIEVGSIGIDL